MASMASVFDNDQMLQEILSWLPAVDLLRLKSTNKRFRDLISESHFMLTQARRSTHNVSGLLCASSPTGSNMVYFPIDNESPQHEAFSTIYLKASCSGLYFRAACNGILLCKEGQRYILCNPTTKVVLHYINFPDARRPLFPDDRRPLLGLVFDPSVPGNNFKLVHIDPSPGFYWFTTYTPELGWGKTQKKLPCKGLQFDIIDSTGSVFFRDTLHWMTESGEIVAYNVETENARMMALPAGQRVIKILCYSNLWLGVSGGCMSLVKVEEGEIFVWVLEDYESCRWGSKKRVGRMEEQSITERVLPLYYDSEKCVLMRWDDTGRHCALLAYKIVERQWYEMRGLEPWMDRARCFVPYTSHMLGKPNQFSGNPGNFKSELEINASHKRQWII